MRWIKSNPGRAFSLGCILLSAGLSFRGAWLSTAGAEWIGLVVITLVAEPSKYFCNHIMWASKGARFGSRCGALLVYLICITASGGLMYLPTLKESSSQQAVQEQQEAMQAGLAARQAAELAKLEARHRETREALEVARTAVVPGIRPSKELRKLLEGQLSSKDRLLLKEELNAAQNNDQLAGKIERLAAEEEKLAKSILGHSRTFTGHPVNVPGHPVNVLGHPETPLGQYVQLLWNSLAIVAAVIIELGIGLGIRTDALDSIPADPPPPSHRPHNGGAKRFEAWLAKEWKARRGKDGWLEGSQQGWARASGFSPGFVHAQLKRLVRLGRIEVRADHRNTWVKFLKVGELKIAT